MSDLYIEKKFYKITHFKINRGLTYDLLSKCLINSIYKAGMSAGYNGIRIF